MLKTLENLQNGMLTSKSYEYAVTNQRIVNIGLSSHVTLEKFHTAPVNAMDLDRIEERFLISGAKNGGICIHDLQNTSGKATFEAKVVCESPRQANTSHTFCITTVQFHPYDTGAFVSSGMDCILNVWDTNQMQPDLTVQLHRKIYCHHMSAVSTRGEVIAVGMQYPHVLLVDPRKGGTCHELRGHEKTVPCVRWSPLSEYILASGGSDGKVLLWDVRSSKGPIYSFDQYNGEGLSHKRSRASTAHSGTVNGLRFTDDGLHLVSIGADNRIRLWDVALGTNTLVNYGLTINNNTSRQRSIEICCGTNPPVLFVPSSNLILAFDLLSGEKIKALVGHFSLINYCLYRSTTHQLISGANDSNILMWSPDLEQGVAEQKGNTEEEPKPSTSQEEDVDNWSDDDDEPN